MQKLSVMMPIAPIAFPAFNGDQLYMHEIDLANPVLPEGFNAWIDAFTAVVLAAYKVGCRTGKAFLTIDQKEVPKGYSHRRPGRHVDGNYLFSWGGGGSGWLTGEAGRYLPPEKHQQQYCSDTGGMIIASSYSACKVWNGYWQGVPAQGGDCSHIDVSGMEEAMLEPNMVYIGNHAIHESVPVQDDVCRSLIRLTLPHDFRVPFTAN